MELILHATGQQFFSAGIFRWLGRSWNVLNSGKVVTKEVLTQDLRKNKHKSLRGSLFLFVKLYAVLQVRIKEEQVKESPLSNMGQNTNLG